MSYVVRQRRREMGVRLALGAEPGSLTRLVVRRGMRYAVLGTATGLAISALESRWLGSLLFRVSPSDPAVLALAVVTLVAVALVASYLPARRATKVDPMVALRYE